VIKLVQLTTCQSAVYNSVPALANRRRPSFAEATSLFTRDPLQQSTHKSQQQQQQQQQQHNNNNNSNTTIPTLSLQ
jgi:hypothetical protein